jgi:Secretion system C-terminal sorting domain/GEVED domain/Ig-like domain CHU_C associated/Fibronectin type III domain
MKKITLWLFALFMCMQINAQVNSYSFTAGSSGVLDLMTGSTQLVASASDDGASAVTSIGFTFNYAGTDYTQFSANANGLVRLGATAVTTQWTNTTANVALSAPAIMPYWDDLATGSAAGGGKVHYVLTGTAPNRKLIIEWFVTIPRNTTGAANAKFQCVLNETSNTIEFVYGSGMLVNTPTTGATVGLATSATLFNTVDVVTNTNSNATFKVDNTAAITAGTTYTWTPPTCPSPVTLTATDVTSSSATLTWGIPSIVPSSGYEYFYSTTNVAPTSAGTVSTTNSVAVTGLTPNTVYYVFTRSNCGSEFGVWTPTGSFITLCVGVTDFIQNFDTSTTGLGNLPSCWARTGTSENVYTTTGSVAPMSPANRLYMNISATTTAYALMPPVSNLQAATHRLKFKAYATAASKKVQVGYFTNPADASTFVLIQEFDLPSTTATTALEFTAIPTALPAGVSRLVFGLIAGSATTVYIDDVKWEVNSSCVEPTALSTASITSNSAQLSWVNGGPETEWEVQYGLTGFTLGSGTIVPGVTTNPYLLSGLTPDTSYQYYVRGVCTGTIYSSWSGPYTFRTLCVGVTDFVETFETTPTGTAFLPACWSRSGTSANVYNTTGSVAPMSPANRLYMNISATTTAFATLPPVTNLQAETHRLKFKAYATAAAKKLRIGYFTNPADVSTFVFIEEIDLPSTTATTATEFTVIPYLGMVPGITNLVFALVPGTATTVYIDDVKWEFNSTCVEPTALNVLSVTNSTAQLSWANGGGETQWQVQYGANGFTLGTGTTVSSVTTNPYTLTGLTANTTYQYYVRGECSGPEFSSWSGPFTFKTLCNDVTTFTENFDTWPSGTNSLPDCWSRAGSSTSTYITTGATAPMSPSNRLYMFATSGADGYAIMPPVSNLQAGTNRLRFKAYATTSPRDLIVGYMTNSADVSSFVPLQTFTIAGTAIANTQEYVVLPTGVPAGVNTLALKNVGFTGASSTFYIDDVTWELIPACANPTGLSSSAITSTSASIAWTGNPTDVSWEIEYGAPGFTLGTGTIVPAATNPFTITSLASSTTYQYYVRSICAGPVTSTSSVSGTFTTLCAAFTPTYTQDFATFLPLCWRTADAGTIATGPTGTGAGYWFSRTYLNTTALGQGIVANLYQDSRIGWIISPIFNLSAGGYQVKYDVGATDYFNADPAVLDADDKIDFLMSVDGGVTWTSLELFNAANTPSNVSTTKVYNIATVTSSNVLFAFRADEGSTPSDTDWDFFVDNFKVDLPAVAAPGCATNIVATQPAGCGNFPISISWDATPTANGYRINVGTTIGGTNIANNVDLGSALTYNLAAPTVGTTYYYTVIPYNTIGNATGCVEQSFSTAATGCYCTAAPTSVDGTGITNVQVGTTNFPNTVATSPVYNDHTATSVDLYQGILNNNLQISFNTSIYDYNTVVWIDLNNDYNFDSTEVVFSGASSAVSPNVQNASFILSPTAPLGSHRMRIVSTDILQAPANPCYSGTYGEVADFTVNVIVPPTCPAPTGNAAQTVCGSGTLADLVVTGSSIVWHDAATAGNVLPSTTAIASGTTYYASQDLTTCVNGNRLAVTATVNAIPATPTGAASQTFCNTDNDDLSDLVVTGTNLVWYDAATGGNVLPTTTLVTATTYYVASTNGTCESPRLAITTTLDCSPAPCLTAQYNQWPEETFDPSANCDGYVAQVITGCAYASEYAVVAVVSGQTYTFASSVATDIITLSADAGVTAVATGTGSLTWVSTVTGTIRFYAHTPGCGAQTTCRIKTVKCGVITNDSPDYVNLQFPATLTFSQGGSGTVYGQIYEGGLTDVAPNITGQAPGVTAWVGISPIGSNTNPNTWTTWIPATWNSGSVGNNDEYQATIGATLLPGTYYYATRFRLNSGAYVYGGIDSSNNGNFWNGTVYNSGVLTVTPPPPPANDNCSGALAVTVNPALTCTAVTAGTLFGATASATDALACGGTEDDDVWFSFVATGTSHQISLTNIAGSTTDLYHSLWTGADCTSLTLVPGTCSDPNTSTPAGLTIGQTYYIRVYSWTDVAGQNTTFNVCVGTLPTPPVNDSCANAIVIGSIPYTNTQDATAATNNAGFINACTSDTMNDGVWYTVVGNGNDIVLNVNSVVGWDPQVGVYTGSCGTFTCVGTVDVGGTSGSETYTIAASTIGTTYYINVGHYSGFTNSPEGPFTIAVTQNLATDSFDNSNFTFYPNPVKDVLNLSYSENITKVQVINLLGQEVRTNSMDATQAQVDMSNLPSGTYLVKVTANDKVKTIKVIKQ